MIYDERFQFCRKIIKVFFGSLDTKILGNALENPEYKQYAHAIMNYLYCDTNNIMKYELQLWKAFRYTSVALIIMKELLYKNGIEWCEQYLELDNDDKIKLMSVTLGKL